LKAFSNITKNKNIYRLMWAVRVHEKTGSWAATRTEINKKKKCNDYITSSSGDKN
jgi:hypothetical protein